MIERTLSIVKPDAVSNNRVGAIIGRFEEAYLKVVGIKMQTLTKEEAGRFYRVHREQPFFESLVVFMSSGPCVAFVLEGEDAVAKTRSLMGATDPKKADKGTIRADFAEGIEANAVHGSDSVENAALEIPFFFCARDLVEPST
ncbi:MAG: nucleoside-diphosphate kinase [Nitrospiria bacterium]